MLGSLCLLKSLSWVFCRRWWRKVLALYGETARLTANGGGEGRLLGLKFRPDLIFQFLRSVPESSRWRRVVGVDGFFYPDLSPSVAVRRLEEWCERTVKRGLSSGFRRQRAAKILNNGVINRRRELWWRSAAELVLPSIGMAGDTSNAPLAAVTLFSCLVDVVKARFSFRTRCSGFGLGSRWWLPEDVGSN